MSLPEMKKRDNNDFSGDGIISAYKQKKIIFCSLQSSNQESKTSAVQPAIKHTPCYNLKYL
jgi:hypothetical protein